MKHSIGSTEAEVIQLRNMKHVQEFIDQRRFQFANHGFLKALEGPGTIEQVKRFAPRVAFFVLCFQDVLRLVHSRSTDPRIKEMANTHAREDLGHDAWYLADLELLGIELKVSWLFSRDHQLARDVAYGQVAQVLTAAHDQTRLAVALSLEAIGAECFGRAIGLLERIGEPTGFQYFARRHQQIEQQHQVFEDDSQHELAQVSIPHESVNEIVAAVESVFQGMDALLSDLERHFRSDQSRAS
jgi:hypothetical protein